MTRWPAIPKLIQGAGGPIRVQFVKTCRHEGESVYGTWDEDGRIIKIERGVPIALKHRILFHELTHAALDDSGIACLLTPEGNESLCEAMATARMRELMGVLGIE